MDYFEKMYLHGFDPASTTPRPTTPEYTSLTQDMSQLYAQLTETLSPDQLDLLEQWMSCKTQTVMYEQAAVFAHGVKVGIKLMDALSQP